MAAVDPSKSVKPWKGADLTGKKFGRLTVKGFAGRNRNSQPLWLCACSCGTEKLVVGGDLKVIRSCGCYALEVRTKHGQHDSPEYRAWSAMIQRCTVPTTTGYHNYGGRGISVCQRWLDSFADFYADLGPRPSSKHTLERINNDGNYEPGNARWATRKEQALNRRTNAMVTYNGQTLPLSEMCANTGIAYQAARARIRAGMSIDDVFSIPVQHKHGHVGTPEYRAWSTMLARCHCPSPRDAKNYRDKGITVCERWKASFLAFLEDMGQRPGPEYMLARHDANGNYEPSNCHWTINKRRRKNYYSSGQHNSRTL